MCLFRGEINRNVQKGSQDTDHNSAKKIKAIITVKFFIAQNKMIIAVKKPGGDQHLQQVIKNGFHFFWFCCFLICCNKFSSSSTEILFSFTRKDTTLLKEPSK